MKATRSSKTAAQMAVSRAIEARRPPSERICDDPFAERFLDRGFRWLIAARPLRDAIPGLIERRFAGHHHYVLARTRYFDDFLTEALTADVRQLVILGAGFDSRAYRFSDRLRDVRVFEVDHPATSSVKRGKLAAILGSVPPNVALVAVDFDRDTVGERLADAGYRADRLTVFLWEGTVPYLTAAGVDETLRFIATGAAGSRLIFDYIVAGVLDGSCRMRGAAAERAHMLRTPEPFVFGIAPTEIATFLTVRGFSNVHDAGADELKARTFPASRRAAYVKPWWRIVHATVGAPTP